MQASAPSADFPCFNPDTAPAEPQAYCAAAKTYLHHLHARHCAALSADFPVNDWIAHYTQQIDRILCGLYARYAGRAALSLIAVGGYGRGELFPHSDIDLLILCPEDKQAQAEAFVRLLWDLGLDIAHSVRSPAQCSQDAAQDHAFLTALLERRFLCGDEHLAAALNPRPADTEAAAEFLAAKLAEQEARDQRQISLGRLEPNIKTDPGGLRDIHMIAWVQRYCLGQQDCCELLRPEECRQLRHSRDSLWRIRFSLHLRIKRPKDVLSFEAQKQLAAQFGHQGEAHLAVQAFMRRYYLCALHVRRLNRLAVKLCDDALRQPAQITPLDEDFILQNRRLALKDPQKLARDPAFVWQIFLRLLAHPEIDSLSPELGRSLQAQRDRFFLPEHQDAAHRGFLELLSQDGNLYREIRRLHRYGLLSRYLPPFAHIVGQMQFDLFHEYSVDQHSLRLFYFLDYFKQDCPQYPEAQRIMGQIKRPALLYLAALLHDIGKGRDGDHSRTGAEIAADYAAGNPRLSAQEGELLVFLVRHHLSLSLTAQKQDLGDPEVIARFAAIFPEPQYLDYLYLLTLADISATNSHLWNSWRAGLMHSLYRLSREQLANRRASRRSQIRRLQSEALSHNPPDAAAIARLWRKLPAAFFSHESPSQLLAKSRILLAYPQDDFAIGLTGAAPRLFIGAFHPPDQIFARVTHFLEQQGFAIAEARLYRQRNGRALQQYSLAGQTPLPDTLLAALQISLRSPLPAQMPKPRLPNPALKHFAAAPRIRLRRHSRHTEMELICTDRHGLLSLISRSLLARRIHLSHAKIATFGERVEDIFYLSDRYGQALSEDCAQALRQELLDLLT